MTIEAVTGRSVEEVAVVLGARERWLLAAETAHPTALYCRAENTLQQQSCY